MQPNSKYYEQIAKAKNIAIVVHRNADMDALGSAIALKRLIKKNIETQDNPVIVDIFTDTQNINETDVNKNIYSVFTQGENINQKNSKKYDLAIALDCANKKLMGNYERLFNRATETLNIDHHQTNTMFAQNNIVIPKFSSTCEIIYTLFIKLLKWKNSDAILRLIYAGIITDTNNLTNNIGRKTFMTIDEISGKIPSNMEQLEKIRNYFFKNETKAKFQLLGRSLENIKFAGSGKIAMMKITKQDFLETKACMTDTLGIVDYATKLKGVEIAIMFIKQDDNTYYVSLRSKNEINVGEIAKKMGGGGHDKVAAFQTKPTDKLKDVKAKLIALCQEKLKIEKDVEKLDDLFIEDELEK